MATFSCFLFVIVVQVLTLDVQAATENQYKNVLFFAVDDLRPELGAYGSSIVKSPNLDALASKSMVFEHAYCQIAVYSPSRASLLTGRRPDTNHVWEISKDEYWRDYTNATSIPQYFKENGYVSIGMGKIFHPGAPSGNDDRAYSWSLPYYLWHAVCNKNNALCKDSCIILKDSLKFTRTPPSQKWTPCNAIVQGLLQFL